MALNMDDRILGGKVENYVSSSSEGSDDEAKPSAPAPPSIEMMNGGRAVRTGPKGVIEDYEEYCRQEKELRLEQQANFYARLKQTAMTVKSEREEEAERQRVEEELKKFDGKSRGDEEDDEFMKEYRIRRMREMYRAQQASMSRFGTFITLTADNFVAEIDKESPQTLVIVHVYEPDLPACDAMNGCLIVLAADHPSVKFCRVRASTVKMSQKFLKHGLPTLLVYQDKQLISSFVSISRSLGKDFFAKDVESFLQEHGLLCENEPGKILGSPSTKPQRNPAPKKNDDRSSSSDSGNDD